MFIELVTPSNHLILCHPFSFCLQFFPASGSFQMSQLCTSGGQSIEFQLQHQSFHEHPGLISFRMGWFDLLAVQGTLRSLLQDHDSKAKRVYKGTCNVLLNVTDTHTGTARLPDKGNPLCFNSHLRGICPVSISWTATGSKTPARRVCGAENNFLCKTELRNYQFSNCRGKTAQEQNVVITTCQTDG